MMNERLNKTLIGSIVFLDIIEYSRKPVAEQIKCKAQLNRLIGDAVESVAEHDRIIVDTGDGVAITLLGSPEDALRISVGIRDRIAGVALAAEDLPFHVRIGINLGPVQLVKDINGQFNVIGDGINVAHRVMSFAESDQILVSRSYYEVASRLTKEIEEMLAYSGIKHDKHVRGHEIYAVRSPMTPVPNAARHGVLPAGWKLWLATGLILAVMAVFAAAQFKMAEPDTETSLFEEEAEPLPSPSEESPQAEPKPKSTPVRKVGKAEHAPRESINCTDAQRSLHQC